MIKALTFIALLLSLPNVWASSTQVYKCEKDGVVVYSQVECDTNAKSVTVELQQGLPEENYQAPHLEQQQSLNQYLKEQDKTRKIALHESRIANYKKQLEQEFNALKQERFRYKADKDKAIKALSDKYNQLIKAEQEAIKVLLKAE